VSNTVKITKKKVEKSELLDVSNENSNRVVMSNSESSNIEIDEEPQKEVRDCINMENIIEMSVNSVSMLNETKEIPDNVQPKRRIAPTFLK